MKHLNFLSKSGSQSGSHRVVTLASTVGSPSAHRRGAMLKLISVLVLILTIGVGQMWGMNANYTIGSQVTSLVDGDYVAWGTANNNLATSIASNWVYCGSTKADWIVFKVVKISNAFYLQNTADSKYVYSSAAKKVAFETSNKTAITLSSVTDKGYLVNGGSSIGNYTFNSTGIRPYSGTNYTAANLYKVNAFAVTYNANGADGGTVPTDNGNYLSGATVTAKSNSGSLTRTGYNFVGWNTRADGNGTNIAATGSATFSITASTTLYAKWESAVSCTSEITIEQGTPSNGSFTMTPNGGTVCIDEGNASVTISNINPSNGYRFKEITSSGGGTINNNAKTVTNISASTTINVVFEQILPFTVSFVTGTGNSAQANISEESSQAGITLPAGPSTIKCAANGWEFAGWSATNVSSETSTAPTILTAGSKYYPTDDCTLYAVYTRTVGGSGGAPVGTVMYFEDFSGFSADDVPSSTKTGSPTVYGGGSVTYTSADNGSNKTKIYDAGTVSEAPELLIGKSGGVLTIAGIPLGKASTLTLTYYRNNAVTPTVTGTNVSIGSATATSVANQYQATITNSGNATTFTLIFTAGGSNVRFDDVKVVVATTTTAGTAYYISSPDCCTPLGTINGSVSLTQTTAALEWADLEHVSSWAVQYKEHSAENWNTWNGAQATADSKRSVTINSLSCGTAYDFKIAATAAAGYCDAEDVLEDQSTTKWDISYTLTNTVEKTAGPETGANACGEISATFSKNALYTFPDEITITIGDDEATVDDDYLWDADEGTLVINAAAVTGNVVVTIAGVAPANPVVTPSPTALSFDQVKKGADVPAAQDITITGQNLTAALVVESSNTSLYTVSLKSGSLTPDGNKDASPVITVTPQAGITSTAGDKNATITISGGGLSEDVVVNVTFNVQETYTVNWYVNGTKIDDNSVTDIEGTEVTAPSDFSAFVDCVPDFHFIGWKEGSAIDEGSSTSKPTLVTPITAIGTANVNYYAVFAEGTPASVDTLLYEEFDNTTTSDASSEFATSKFPNFNGSLSKAYTSQYGGVKFGTGSVAGYITSKSLDLSEAFTVSLKARYYNTGGDNASIQVTVGSQTKTISYEDLTNDFKSFSLDFDAATSTSTVKIGTDAKRAYIDNVLVSQTIAEDFSMYYTTCPHVSRVTLSAPEISNGSISFAVNSEAVTNVRTDGGEDVEVDVVAAPATGYELTGVALSGTAASHASYDAGVITIDAGTEGALTATATFEQANYTVTMAQTGGASAELSADQTNKHYNDVITVTAEDKAGYVFQGWSASPAVTFANAKALSTTFSMPDGNVEVTATYEAVHDVAWALANTPSTGSSDSVYVKGLISKKEKLESDNTISYWISDNGQHTTGSVLEVYKGKGVNKVTFSSLDDLNVGDAVVVRGKLKTFSGTKEFDNGNYMYSRTVVALSALTIVGDASVTTYDVGDSFDKTGLSLTATYNTGYVQANYTGTTITSNYDAPTTFTAGVTSVTVSAEEGLISTSRDIAVTVSSAVLDHVVISADAQTEFWVKETYKEPLLDAYLTDEPATVLHNVTGVSTTTGLDMSVTGNKSVTVTYTRKVGQTDDVTYNFTVKPIAVDEANAHSVATAREIIDLDNDASEDLDLELAANKTHVIGVVTNVSALTGANAGKYTIVIKDQTDATKVMTLYQVTLKSGITSVAQNDIIKAYGNLYYHSQSNKYEINTGGEVVAVVRTPNLTVADVAEMEVNFTADMAEADLTIDRDGSEGAITFSCSDAAVTIVNNKLHAATAGDATVTATIAADGIYTAASTTFSVHVIAERTRYAITMDKNGGSGVDPVYENQLAGATVDLPATNTYSKANSAFAGWVVNDGAVEITDGHFTMPAAAVTIKATWNDVETCTISFQVSGGEVATADAPQTAEFSLAGVSHPTVEGFEFVGWSETEYDDETTTLPTTITSYTPALNQESKTLYGIYSQVVGGASNLHYVLDYTDDGVSDESLGYGNATDITATDGSEWVVKAYKNQGMQINTGKDASIKIPDCPADIISISITCGAAKAVGLSASDYSGSGTITYIVYGTDATSQTLDLSGEHVTGGYIVAKSGSTAITHIDVEYSGNVTYYTSSPITRYTVTYAKGDATGVTGLCEAQRKAAGSITLCDAPTCADKVFAKWSDGTNLYAAGASYTLSADVTFTATWTPKPKYTVTYTANGGTGTAPDVEEYMEGETVEVKENEYFEKPGFVYAGWQVVYNDGTDHIITPNDEGEFEMVAYNVTIKALWEEPSNQKWVRVESTDELATDGTNYIIVASQANAAMGALNGAVYNSIGIVKTGNYLNGPESMTKVTLEDGSEDGKYAMKHGTKYLYSTTAKNIGERDDSFDWTITIANGVATINAGTAGTLQYNSGNPRFTTYTSSQQAVAIYREKALTPINQDDMTEADVNTYDDVEIAQNKTWTVENDKEVGDVYMKEGAVIANSATVTANDLYFKAKAGKSNQIFDLNKITVVSNMYYDFQLCDGDVDADYWYSISVPFDVDLNDGVFQVGGTTPLVNHTDFEVWEYDTQKRADTQSNGWKRSSDNMMHAGKAYLIGFNPGQPNIIRLKAAAGWKTNLFSGSSMSVVSTGGSGTHDNWNGLANPTGRYIDVDADAQVFNNNTHQFDPFTYDAQAYNFVVGTAFFVQTASAIAISNTDHHNYRAPQYNVAEKYAYAVRIAKAEAENYDNQVVVRASADATNEYEQGHDMLTMNEATSKTAALLWTKNYGGKRLAIEEAPLNEGVATYELGIYAPANGTYTIAAAEAKDDADLYLTYEGTIIWNLSTSAYELDLTKGTADGYGLMLVRKAPQIATGVENVQGDKTQCTKVVLNDHVYILRGEKMFDVTGKAVR